MDLLHLHFQGDCNSGEVQFSGSRSANPSSEMPGESSCFALDVLPYNSRMYTFLLDEPHLFLYFGIFDEKMERSEAVCCKINGILENMRYGLLRLVLALGISPFLLNTVLGPALGIKPNPQAAVGAEKLLLSSLSKLNPFG